MNNHQQKSESRGDSTYNKVVDVWIEEHSKRAFRTKLLKWYRRHRRDLPWRESRDPYRVWVSEVMLQQTQVATVIDYFHRFIKTLPTVESLAAADEQVVLKLWEGLGYYRRARQLHAAAKKIVADFGGRIPMTVEELQSLPGVGRYTAGAIASIAFDVPAPILEGNTVRLFARILGLDSDIRLGESQRAMWTFSEHLVAGKGAGEFNQALMELGSLVCRDREPNCLDCPVTGTCLAFATGRQKEIPVSTPKFEYESIREAVVVTSRGKTILMRQCQPGERWYGLWDFPRYPFSAIDSRPRLQAAIQRDCGLFLVLGEDKFSLRHAVTRFRIELTCISGKVLGGRLRRGSGFRWIPIDQMGQLSLNSTGRKIAERIGLFLS